MNTKRIGIALLVWAAGMLGIMSLNGWLGLSQRFTWAHVVGAACLGSLIDYLLFIRRTKSGKGDTKSTRKNEILEEPSDDFLRAFSEGFGSVEMRCEFCGRVYFNEDDPGCFEEGELEKLKAKAKKDPEKYIGVDYSLSAVSVEGRRYVEGCPCNVPRKYEEWIWRHRAPIADYLRRRRTSLLADVGREAEDLQVPPEA